MEESVRERTCASAVRSPLCSRILLVFLLAVCGFWTFRFLPPGILHRPGVAGKDGVSTPEELWRTVESGDKQKDWYGASVSYWDGQEASYNGVLGGYGHVSDADIQESDSFLQKALAGPLQEAARGGRKLRAVDCGAGVGRVTEQLLLHRFAEVDLLEPSGHLLSKAEERLHGNHEQFPAGHKLGRVMKMGLQDFSPEHNRYDVIWIQWALLYLTDDDAIQLFDRCRHGLKKDGIIFVKENICSDTQDFIFDKDDTSVTRSHSALLKLFKSSKLQLLRSAKQKNFPKELYAVQMYALRPQGI